MKESLLLQNRLRELADKSYSQNIYTYSVFLSLAEQNDYHAIERELHFASPVLFGGPRACKRVDVLGMFWRMIKSLPCSE